MGTYMIKLMVEPCGLVQQSNEDAAKPKFSRNNWSCKSKSQYLLIEEGREGWEDRESWAFLQQGDFRLVP